MRPAVAGIDLPRPKNLIYPRSEAVYSGEKKHAEFDVNSAPSSHKEKSWSQVVEAIFAIALLAAVLFLGRDVEHYLDLFRSHIAGLGFLAFVLFVLLYPLLTSLLVPDTVIGFAVGASFGLVKGFAVGIVGALLSVLVQYLLAHSLLNPWITRWLESRPRMRALQSAVLLGQYRLQFLIRLLPVNRAAMSYAFGAGGVTLASYMTACIAIIPHVFLEVYMGYASTRLIQSSVSKGTFWHADHLPMVAGIVVSVLVLVALSRMAKRSLDSAIEAAGQQQIPD